MPKKNTVDVIIETPKGSRNKYAFDEDLKAFKLKKTLPTGAAFPFDFGMIPETKGEDGDPLDVLVIMDEPTYPGVVVESRIIGALKAKQTERDGNAVRNDRLIAVSVESNMYKLLKEVRELNKHILEEIQHFFISYNEQAGKRFKPLGWSNASATMRMIEKQKLNKE
jgi:inorganic pyrophosphatase